MGNFDQYGSPVFTVRMHRDLWKRIAERCEEMKTNRSDFVRKAVETALTKPSLTNNTEKE
jgi:metal-responsive CopG/Arc/MetJ family transcriptional regulator